jgi:3-hydroxyacyl-[acyl-carrier-protein] dehydratase
MTDSPVMTFKDIIKILPHRYPFLLIDRVESLVRGPQYPNRTGNRIECTKCVTINEPFFPGHFPHRPVMPGVLIVEAMAQASALCCYRPEDPKQDVAFVSISDAKFRVPVGPGDTLDIVVECLKDRGSMMSFKGTAHVRGKLVAEAEFLAKMFNMETE